MGLSLQYPPTPEYAAQHAELAVKAGRSVSYVRLDYSVRSLKRLDSIIARFRREQVKGSEIRETLFTFGCYVGEVMIRHCGGEWLEPEETPLGRAARVPMVVRLRTGDVANPIDKVFKRLKDGKEDSLPTFYQLYAPRAASGPEDEARPTRKWYELWKRDKAR
jgi:hypothetical protein